MISVVIVDDHAVVREGLQRMLDREPGIRVIGAAINGREAIDTIERCAPEIALMDVSMPEINGIDAVARLRERRSATAFIGLSMHADRHYVMRAMQAGMRGYLTKDSSCSELVRAVRIVHAGGRYISEALSASMLDVLGERPPPSDRWAQLTAREQEILQLVVEGATSVEIGGRLHLSSKTIDTYRSRMMRKLGVGGVAALVRLAMGRDVAVATD